MGVPVLEFDEAAHAGPEHLDRAYVVGYDRKAATDPAPDVQALRDAGVGASSVVVDLGAGTGTFAAAMAPHCREVVAVDVSVPMLDAARARFAHLGLHYVRCVEAGFLTYRARRARSSMPCTRVTRCTTFPTPGRCSRSPASPRCSRRAGCCGSAISCTRSSRATPRQCSSVGSRARAPTSDVGWTRAELEEHVRTEYSAFSWVLEPMLTRCGFEVRAAEYAPSQTYRRVQPASGCDRLSRTGTIRVVKLSDGVEWGVHACVLLAVLPPDAALPAARLAEYHGVPSAYLAKHLQALARGGVLETVKGPRGGYRLARPAGGDHRARRGRGDRRRRARVPLHRDPPARSDGGARARVPVRRAASTACSPAPTTRGARELAATTIADLVVGVVQEAPRVAAREGRPLARRGRALTRTGVNFAAMTWRSWPAP